MAADMRQRQSLSPPRSSEGGDVLLNLPTLVNAVARALDRLLRVDDEKDSIRRQSHGSGPSRRKRPIVELEHDMRLVSLALAPRKVGARAVLGRDCAQSECADIVAAGQRRGLDNFAPGEHRIAGEERRDMPATVDRRDMEGVGEAVET